MPVSSRRSGPAVVVNRAVSELSGRSAFRIDVRFGEVLGAASSAEVEGMEIWYSLMIWSAIFLLSDDRRGDRFLIYAVSVCISFSCTGNAGSASSVGGAVRGGDIHCRLLFEHGGRSKQVFWSGL
jgi:hypothetical protein